MKRRITMLILSVILCANLSAAAFGPGQRTVLQPTIIPAGDEQTAVPTMVIPPTAEPPVHEETPVTAVRSSKDTPASVTPTAEPAAAVPTETEVSAAAVPAEPFVPEIDPMKLLETADTDLFIREGYYQDFSETQGYLNEILENGVIHQYHVHNGRGSDVLMSMFPAKESVQSTNLRLNMKEGRAVNFHAAFTLQRIENHPANAGGRCWIRCSNSASKASGSESGVILFPGDAAYVFTPENGTLHYERLADLSILNQNRDIRFEFIRQDGVFYAYANGEFLFAYEDGIEGTVSFEGGSELFSGGNRVRCEFDDFTVRF